jgi:hypothetical protein
VILGFLLGSQARRADGGRLAGLGFLLGLLILPFSVVRRLQADGCTTTTHRTWRSKLLLQTHSFHDASAALAGMRARQRRVILHIAPKSIRRYLVHLRANIKTLSP